MDKMNWFMMVAMGLCMTITMAAFQTLPATAPGAAVMSFMIGLRGSITLLIVWFPTAIAVQVFSLCHLLGPQAYYSKWMVLFHWVASGLSVGTTSAAWAITYMDTHFRQACIDSLDASCWRYKVATGLAMIVAMLTIVVALVVTRARLAYGPRILPIAGGQQQQQQQQGQQ